MHDFTCSHRGSVGRAVTAATSCGKIVQKICWAAKPRIVLPRAVQQQNYLVVVLLDCRSVQFARPTVPTCAVWAPRFANLHPWDPTIRLLLFVVTDPPPKIDMSDKDDAIKSPRQPRDPCAVVLNSATIAGTARPEYKLDNGLEAQRGPTAHDRLVT
eukprot:scaffold2476_cov193-Amphora_coffeaeformis.AAC.19